MPALLDASSPLRRNASHCNDDERDGTHLKRKTKRGTWEGVHHCVVHHHDDRFPQQEAARASDCSETDVETEPENDVFLSSDEESEDLFLCREHANVFNAIHVRRSNFLKPSTGDVEIVPMMPSPDHAMGHAIGPETSSTTCSEQLENEKASADVDACPSSSSFTWFRINYVLVMSAIMLADGLQGGCHKNVIRVRIHTAIGSMFCI